MKLCRCGHPLDQHIEGVCVGETTCGDVCDCMSFKKKGKRAKKGKGQQDALDRWHRSTDAPIGNDSDNSTLGSLIGSEDGALAVAGNGDATEEQWNNAIDEQMRTLYRKGRMKRARKHAERDLKIYDEYMAGKTGAALAAEHRLSQARVVMIVSDVKSYLFQIVRQRWTNEAPVLIDSRLRI